MVATSKYVHSLPPKEEKLMQTMPEFSDLQKNYDDDGVIARAVFQFWTMTLGHKDSYTFLGFCHINGLLTIRYLEQ